VSDKRKRVEDAAGERARGREGERATQRPTPNAQRLLTAALTYMALFLIASVFVLPFVWMVSTSLKEDSQVFSERVQWVPHPFVWRNYPDALASFPFMLYLRNTLFVCVLTMAGTVVSAALPAYGFSRLRWRGRDALFLVLLATIMLPAQVTMLPVFLIFRRLGWTGTFLPLVVPPFLGSAFSIFLLRQFFMTIPQELSDAARIDGCSEAGILWRVIVPMAKPAIATVALFAFTGAWMDFLNPLIYLHDERTYTLAIGLQAFLGRHGGEWSLLMAAATVMTAPMLVLFFFAQRTFIQGIALTGMKG
jgi:multiple sugar transport system permease protein